MDGSKEQGKDRERIVRETLATSQPHFLPPGASRREEEVTTPEGRQDLLAELSATLAPHLHHALENLPRRRILRALNASIDAQTLEDLDAVVPATNVGTLRYHVQILEKAGCVSQYSQVVQTNRMLPACISNVRDSRLVMDALRVSDREDDRLKG